MLLLEPSFPDPVLLGVMEAAQADAPAVGRLERHAAIGSRTHMRAFDREPLAARHAAVVLAYPGSVARAGAGWRTCPG